MIDVPKEKLTRDQEKQLKELKFRLQLIREQLTPKHIVIIKKLGGPAGSEKILKATDLTEHEIRTGLKFMERQKIGLIAKRLRKDRKLLELFGLW